MVSELYFDARLRRYCFDVSGPAQIALVRQRDDVCHIAGGKFAPRQSREPFSVHTDVVKQLEAATGK